ncbi:MAG: DUF1611 domain-containing protein [Calditrichae bacterium]|nr:DUF1611 domain-containing protein [Calditrichota bacterium]MCB9057631.1 DUF1611 domain-containing protein [Calditrichia bacterium]
MKRRIIIHTENPLKPVQSKLESDLVRYLNSEIIGIIDPKNSGKNVQDVLGFGGDIPIASTLDEFLTLKPNYLLLGASSFKGTFPMEWYPMVIKALQMRVHILNGLHQPLSSLAEFDLLAKKYKAKIIDLRDNGEKPIKFKNLTTGIQAKKVLIAGSNPNAGKLTTIMELTSAFHKSGISADWIATGLSSRLIKGKGFIAESMIADLISGYVENELIEQDQKFQYLFVEGQGSINDPIYAAASIAVLHGTRPDAVVLCHNVDPAQDSSAILSALNDYENVLNQINKAPVIGLSLNTIALEEDKAKNLLENVGKSLDIPVFDPLGSNLNEIIQTLKNIQKL